jgi:hypothetical protein
VAFGEAVPIGEEFAEEEGTTAAAVSTFTTFTVLATTFTSSAARYLPSSPSFTTRRMTIGAGASMECKELLARNVII